MKTMFRELTDCFMLWNRIKIYLIFYDPLVEGWEIQTFGKNDTFRLYKRDRTPKANLS